MYNKDQLLQLLTTSPHVLFDMTYNEIKDTLGIDIAKMYQYNQDNPHHCYNLYEHSVHTIIHIYDMNIDMSVKQYLLVAALFHDVGKIETAFYKNGCKHFYGHAIKSRSIAYPLLMEMGFNHDEVLKICFYIEHHDDFISFNDDQIDHHHIFKVINKVISYEYNYYGFVVNHCDFINLMYLCIADALSQSEEVYKKHILINSKALKLKKTYKIIDIIKDSEHL